MFLSSKQWLCKALDLLLHFFHQIKDPSQDAFHVLYEIITSKDLQFDIDGIQNKTSFLCSLAAPLWQSSFQHFLRMAESMGAILNNDNIDTIAENFFEAIEDKFRFMIEWALCWRFEKEI